MNNTLSPHLEEETEADPLIVFMIPPLIWIECFVDPWMCYIKPNAFPERTWYRICRMDPAKCVKYVLWNVFGVDTVNGITHILFGRNYEGEREHACGRYTIVKTKHPRVYMHV